MNPILLNMDGAGQAKAQSGPFHCWDRFFSPTSMSVLLSVYSNPGVRMLAGRGGLKRFSRPGPFSHSDFAGIKENDCSAIREPVRSLVCGFRKNKKPRRDVTPDRVSERNTGSSLPGATKAAFKNINIFCFREMNPIRAPFNCYFKKSRKNCQGFF